jgi:hypothetical protein
MAIKFDSILGMLRISDAWIGTDPTKVLKSWDTMTGNLTITTNTTTTWLAVTQSGTGKSATFMWWNVGIGTITPAYALDIVGNIRTGDTNGRFLLAGSTYPSLTAINSVGTTVSQIVFDNPVGGVVFDYSGAATGGSGYFSIRSQLNTPSKTVFIVNPAGNVGIGTTTPAYALDINGHTNISTWFAYKYNWVNAVSAVTSHFGWFFGPSGNLTHTGDYNVGIGQWAMTGITSAFYNTGIWAFAFQNLSTGGNNFALWLNSGRYWGSGTNALTDLNNSILIGGSTSPAANGDTNEIVIGSNLVWNGSNTVTLWNTAITTTILQGNIGVWTTTPTQRLTVIGNAVITWAIYASWIQNPTNAINSQVNVTTVGTQITRNVWDTSPALSIQQQNSASTWDILQLQNNWWIVIAFTQSWKLWIGTTAPLTPLHIVWGVSGNVITCAAPTSNSNWSTLLMLSDQWWTGYSSIFQLDGAWNIVFRNQNTGKQTVFDYSTSGTLSFRYGAGWPTVLYANSSQNVGIWNTSPLGKLHVWTWNVVLDNTYGYQIRLSSGTAVNMITCDAGNNGLIGANSEIKVNGSVTLQPPATVILLPWVGDSASAIGTIVNTANTFVTAGAKIVSFQNAWSEKVSIDKDGKIGIGISATALIHAKAGTATAGTAPLKLTAWTNLTTPESGAFEFDGTNLYFTVGGVRKMVTLV